MRSAAESAAPAASDSASSGDPSTDKLAQVLARGTLILFTDPKYPPQSFAVKGAQARRRTRSAPRTSSPAPEMAGYDADTGKLVAKALGVEPCFVTPSWTEVTAGNWGDRWDLAYGSGAIDFDRMDVLYMTQPYYSTPANFFVPSSSAQEPSDLAGKRVGACAGCTMEKYLRGTLELPGPESSSSSRIRRSSRSTPRSPGLEATAKGKLDASSAPSRSAPEAITTGALRMLATPAYYSYKTGYVDKKSGLDVAPFVERVDEIVAALHADGTLKRLSVKYFGKDYATKAASSTSTPSIKRSASARPGSSTPATMTAVSWRRRLPSSRRSLMARLVLTFLLLSRLMVAHRRRGLLPAGADSLEDSVFDRLERRRAEGGLARPLDRRAAAQRRVRRPGCSAASRPADPPRVGTGRASELLADARDRGRAPPARAASSTSLRYVVVADRRRAGVPRARPRRRVVVSTAGARGRHPGERGVLRRAAAPGPTCSRSRPRRSPAKPTITVATPLFDSDGQRIGVVAANLNLERLDRIVLPRTGLGGRGRVLPRRRGPAFVHASLGDRRARRSSSTGIDRALAGNAAAVSTTATRACR